jgi:hypothetical protein
VTRPRGDWGAILEGYGFCNALTGMELACGGIVWAGFVAWANGSNIKQLQVVTGRAVPGPRSRSPGPSTTEIVRIALAPSKKVCMRVDGCY